MDQKLTPARRFQGTLRVPSDKSITHRAIFISSLSDGESIIKDPLMADDCLSTAFCMEQLGVSIQKNGGVWRIEGRGLRGFKKPMHPLNCGNSGTTMRLITGILAAQDFTTELYGDASLSKRPMDRVANPLTEMGAKFALSKGKFSPFKVTGSKSLKAIEWKNAIASAQVKTAVLMAGLHAKGETSFEEPFLSRDHTERMLESCGVKIRRQGNKVSVHGPASLKPRDWIVPGDFSSAAFFIVGALLIEGADVTLEAVNLNPTRSGLLEVLQKMGATFRVQTEMRGGEPLATIHIKGRATLTAGEVTSESAPNLIDEIPILAVAATQARGTTLLRGIEELRVKETDRLKAMTKNLKAMGAQIKEEPDGLLIEGPTPLHGAEVDSFHDHRIAMSMAIAAMIADGETVIKNPECVAISFPNFWETLWHLKEK